MKAFFTNIKTKISYFFKAHTTIAISLWGVVLLAALVPVVIIFLNDGNVNYESSSNITSIYNSSSNNVSYTQKESSVFQSTSSNESVYLTSENSSVNSETSSSNTSSHNTSSKPLNSSSVTSHKEESNISSSFSSASSNVDETYTSSPDVTEEENFIDVRLGVWHIFKKSVSNEENYEAFYLSFEEDDENLGEYFSGYAPTLEPTEKLNDNALLEEYRENGNTETINNTEYYH